MKAVLLTLALAFAAYFGWIHRANNSVATADLSSTEIQQLVMVQSPQIPR